MIVEFPDDPVEIAAHQWQTKSGRYGTRVYQNPDGSYWLQHWATRSGDWGTRVFATLEEARKYLDPVTP